MKQLKSINRSKSTGVDDLLPNMLKDAASVVAAPLMFVINLSLKSDLFSTEWKAAKITPVHKSGTHSNFHNYRFISILLVLPKVIEKLIHQQLLGYLEENCYVMIYQEVWMRVQSLSTSPKHLIISATTI